MVRNAVCYQELELELYKAESSSEGLRLEFYMWMKYRPISKWIQPSFTNQKMSWIILFWPKILQSQQLTSGWLAADSPVKVFDFWEKLR